MELKPVEVDVNEEGKMEFFVDGVDVTYFNKPQKFYLTEQVQAILFRRPIELPSLESYPEGGYVVLREDGSLSVIAEDKFKQVAR